MSQYFFFSFTSTVWQNELLSTSDTERFDDSAFTKLHFVYSDGREWMVTSLWPSFGGGLTWPVLPSFLCILWDFSERKQENYVCQLPYIWYWLSCSQFILKKTKMRLHVYFLEWKDQNTSWLFFLIMLLQSGLQPTIDCLGSVDKQKVWVDIFLDVPSFCIHSSLSSSYTF